MSSLILMVLCFSTGVTLLKKYGKIFWKKKKYIIDETKTSFI